MFFRKTTRPIIEVAFCSITENDTGFSLYNKVQDCGISLFKKWLPKFIEAHKNGTIGEIPKVPQDDGEKRYFNQRSSMNDKYIPLEKLKAMDEAELMDNIRAFDFPPWEPLYTKINGHKVYLSTGYRKSQD